MLNTLKQVVATLNSVAVQPGERNLYYMLGSIQTLNELINALEIETSTKAENKSEQEAVENG